MSHFQYRAMNQAGKIVKGLREAASASALSQQLLAEGLDLLSCKAHQPRFSAWLRQGRGRLPATWDLLGYLPALLSAGIPLYEALQLLQTQFLTQPRVYRLLTSWLDELAHGACLSQAIRRHRHTLDAVSMALIETGEASGALADALQLGVSRSQQARQQFQQLRAMLIYPVLTLLVLLLAFGVILYQVMPPLLAFNHALGIELPWYSRWLAVLSGWVRQVSPLTWLLGGLLVGLCAAIGLLGRRYWLQIGVLLRFPLIGRYLLARSWLRCFQSLSVLYQSGLPLLTALPFAGQSLGYRPLTRMFEEATRQIEQGGRLSDGVTQALRLTPTYHRLLVLGEESGTLSNALAHIQHLIQESIKEKERLLMSWFQPLTLLMVAIVLLWMLLTVFSLVYDQLGSWR